MAQTINNVLPDTDKLLMAQMLACFNDVAYTVEEALDMLHVLFNKPLQDNMQIYLRTKSDKVVWRFNISKNSWINRLLFGANEYKISFTKSAI